MNPDEPMIPDPVDPTGPQPEPVSDPPPDGQPDTIRASAAPPTNDGLDAYDEADADSFPASDPPAASEPGVG